jgi:putative oxidoreductase
MQKLIHWVESRRELWLDCIRIYLGLGLLARGVLLVTNAGTGYFVDLIQRSSASWLFTGAALHYVILAHFIGGAMLTVGFLTRIAAAVQIPVLIGAVFFIHRNEGLATTGQSLEFSALVLFLLAMIFVSGAGKLSLDHVIFHTDEAPAPHEDEPLPVSGR